MSAIHLQCLKKFRYDYPGVSEGLADGYGITTKSIPCMTELLPFRIGCHAENGLKKQLPLRRYFQKTIQSQQNSTTNVLQGEVLPFKRKF
jgi:hypothetical protein